MQYAAAGLTYRETAAILHQQPKTTERQFERLISKLRPWNVRDKASLVHWLDSNYAAWRKAAEDLDQRDHSA
jgi:hypothetical protein